MDFLLIILGIVVFGAALYGALRLNRVSDPDDVQDSPMIDASRVVTEEQIAALRAREETPPEEAGEPIGYRVTHRTIRSRVCVIPILSKPFINRRTGERFQQNCPTCHVLHPVKCIHLWLDDTGSAIVSAGVLEELKSAGMPELDYVGVVRKPPPLRAGHGISRAEVDQQNRKIVQYKVV